MTQDIKQEMDTITQKMRRGETVELAAELERIFHKHVPFEYPMQFPPFSYPGENPFIFNVF